jgi:branched-chain amino acid aminotransferase
MAVRERMAERATAAAAHDWPDGAAFVDGAFCPIGEAKISVLDWGFSKSDVTYDVVHVWRGSFFRLDDHLDRFEASMRGLRMRPPYTRDEIADILAECVRRTGLRDAYVAMICTRGAPKPGQPRKPGLFENRFIAYAVPWIWVMTPEQQARGAHLIVARTRRIPPDSVDPTIKNFHWGDLVAAMFEAEDRGADNAVLLDHDGYVTEGPGFNVFAVIGGEVVSPDRGALEGITRRSVMELCAELGIPCRTGRITAEQLKAADEVFGATTAGGVMPVARIDDAVLSGDRPGPISTRLREAYWRKHEEGWHATPIDYGRG